jgi:gliding motility-associated-like protein
MTRKLIFLITVFLVSSYSVFCQGINGPEQDCPFALPVCQTIYQQTQTYSGGGLIKDLPDNINCLTNEENNSVWYIFTVNTSGSLEMRITPLQPDDYDFAIYNLTGKNCSSITQDSLLPVRCNYSAFQPSALPPNNNPETGLRDGFLGTSSGVSDPNFLAPLNVLAGETYVLVVDNFNINGGGYILDFTTNMPNPASIVDVTAPAIISTGNFTCDTTRTIVLNMSENVRCNSIDTTGGQFFFTGPSTVSVIKAEGVNCGEGALTNQIVITIAEPIVVGGIYNLNTGQGVGGLVITDFCDNELQNNPFPINANDIVFADFDYTIRASCAKDTFYYEDRTLGSPTAWSWNFGDGSPISTDENPIHTYPDTTEYTLTLIVSSANCSDTISRLVDISSSFKADFIIGNNNPCIGDTVFFIDNSPGTATTYLWDFGDGNIAGIQNPFNIYNQAGDYLVTLTISDISVPGCVDTATGLVFVKPLPDANFIADTDPICSGLPVRFTDNTTGTVESRFWDFGNGNTAVDSVAVYVFPIGGSYDITHRVTDLFCGFDEVTLTFDVLDRPQFNLGEDTAVCLSETVVLAGPANALSYRWSTGETTQNITFSDVPNEVSLTVTASNGCFNSDDIFIDEQNEDCFYVKVPSAFSPNGDGKNDFLKIFLQRIQSFELKIFNRWGELVYETNNANLLWDGTYKGEAQDIGVFQYYIEGVSISGDRFFRSGTVTLIR